MTTEKQEASKTPVVEAAELCSVSVDRSGSSRWSLLQPCGRVAVRDGKCALHLRAEAKRAEKERKWDADRDRAAAIQQEASDLSVALGVAVTAEYDSLRNGGLYAGYTGNFTVPAEWLRQIAASTTRGSAATPKESE